MPALCPANWGRVPPARLPSAGSCEEAGPGRTPSRLGVRSQGLEPAIVTVAQGAWAPRAAAPIEPAREAAAPCARRTSPGGQLLDRRRQWRRRSLCRSLPVFLEICLKRTRARISSADIRTRRGPADGKRHRNSSSSSVLVRTYIFKEQTHSKPPRISVGLGRHGSAGGMEQRQSLSRCARTCSAAATSKPASPTGRVVK